MANKLRCCLEREKKILKILLTLGKHCLDGDFLQYLLYWRCCFYYLCFVCVPAFLAGWIAWTEWIDGWMKYWMDTKINKNESEWRKLIDDYLFWPTGWTTDSSTHHLSFVRRRVGIRFLVKWINGWTPFSLLQEPEWRGRVRRKCVCVCGDEECWHCWFLYCFYYDSINIIVLTFWQLT